MTREEAVTVLKGLMENPLFNEVHKVAFNIAIHDITQRHEWDINNLILINKENYEPQSFKWCNTCREYDQEKHCCHRWSKVIRDTVEEMKQEHIEREVLDKIRAEIETKYGQCSICEYDSIDGDFDGVYTDIGDIADILQIIDKYKRESEG